MTDHGGWALRAGAAAMVVAATGVIASSAPSGQERPRPADGLRFEVSLAGGVLPARATGRLIVVVTRRGQGEPRRGIGRLAPNPTPMFADDVVGFTAGDTAVIDASSAAFPYATLADLPVGDYRAQAVLDVSRDTRSLGAVGNVFSRPQAVTVGGGRESTVRLDLTEREPDDELPVDNGYLRFVQIRSDLLSAFHGRPMYLRAGVIVPRGYDDEPERRYPLRVHVGGYAKGYTDVERLMRSGSAFRAAWLADDTPRMILVHLDGAGPYGDPYQVNSANNGPYGDAVTQELIPHVEARFRGIGEPAARVVDGGSTGGWVSLALQISYPDFFNGAWSYCPDGVDFRQLQLVDIYRDENAYVDARGRERPAAREISGDVRFTMRHELRMENVLGAGDSWTRSGRQWGAWNAAYGPRGPDGQPVPLWDPVTGAIDRGVARHWERYDLRLRLAREWTGLAPKLRGKIHIWVGEADDYFLNNAVHLLDDFFEETDPSFDARIRYGVGQGHCWVGLSAAEIMREMGTRTGAGR